MGKSIFFTYFSILLIKVRKTFRSRDFLFVSVGSSKENFSSIFTQPFARGTSTDSDFVNVVSPSGIKEIYRTENYKDFSHYFTRTF